METSENVNKHCLPEMLKHTDYVIFLFKQWEKHGFKYLNVDSTKNKGPAELLYDSTVNELCDLIKHYAKIACCIAMDTDSTKNSETFKDLPKNIRGLFKAILTKKSPQCI